MEHFETELLPEILSVDIKWVRYVDDVFAVIPCNLDIDKFFRILR